MELTPEQIDIIQSTGNIKINAVAGSGKTTTMIEYAKARPQTARILYLAFNKSVKIDAQKKFIENGLKNVKVETAHSLAYKNIVYQHRYKVRTQAYKTNEIAELLNLEGFGEKHGQYIIANHVNKFVTYFCNSDKSKVQDLNYLDTISDKKVQDFVASFYKYLELQTRLFLSKMDKGEIEIIHDFYLKKFQLSNPQLPYDYILFDEGQDASSAMLDIFMKQKATKVIVGDTHQQIYGWRYAVNSLEKADFTNFHLSTSFRFSQDIASLGVEVLRWKKHLGENIATTITGKGTCNKAKSTAVIGRTNLGLLLKAIEFVTERKKLKKIYFEGNFNSYTYADEGASLYDVLNLQNNKKEYIRDKLIKEMNTIEELEDYVEKTDDVQLGMMIEIVREYGDEIPSIINKIKEKHIDNDDKSNAEVIFSTVHRSKGMEYDVVHLVNDFISEEKLEKIVEEKEMSVFPEKLIEEINLLYVAITRTKNLLHIPQQLMPSKFPTVSHIQVVEELSFEEKKKRTAANKKANADKAYAYSTVRTQHKDAYKAWTEDQDEELTDLFCEGKDLHDLAKHFGRTKGAIRARIKKLELEEKYGWDMA